MTVYLNPKTKKYYCTFRYTDWQGNRKQKKKEGFKLAREAKAFELEFLSKNAANCTMKFKSLCELYLEDFKSRHKITTYKAKESCINAHLIDAFGELSIDSITVLNVRNWQNKVLKTVYADTYKRYLNTQLSALFNFAVKYYGLKSNPVRDAGTIGKKNADEIDFWTVDEFKTFIKTIDESKTDYCKVADNEALITVFTLLFYTGIRLGEMLALTVDDFKPPSKNSNASININKSYAFVDGQEIIQEPKTNKSKRSITLPEKVWKKVKSHIERLHEPTSKDRLFYMFSKSNLSRALKTVAAAANVKPIRLHDLRHSHASMLIDMEINVLAISERLGHEDIQTTLNIYGHLYPSKVEQIAEKLNAVL